MITFTERELHALPVQEYVFAGFLASLIGRVLIRHQHVAAGCACTEEEEVATFV